MLAIEKDHTRRIVRPNLLPCTIRHDGLVSITDQHWTPTVGADGTQTSFFRGRKLLGQDVKLPAGYEGVVLQPTDRKVDEQAEKTVAEVDEDEPTLGQHQAETKIVKSDAVFDRITVWEHEAVPSEDHTHIKAMEEWISFAEAMHSSTLPRPKT